MVPLLVVRQESFISAPFLKSTKITKGCILIQKKWQHADDEISGQEGSIFPFLYSSGHIESHREKETRN